MGDSTRTKPKAVPTPPPPGALVLTYLEVAFVLRNCENSVRRMVEKGLLSTVPLSATGRKRGVLRTTLDAFLRSQERTESNEEAVAVPPARPSLRAAGWDGVDHIGSAKRRPKP